MLKFCNVIFDVLLLLEGDFVLFGIVKLKMDYLIIIGL
jgi:hypothetical protein